MPEDFQFPKCNVRTLWDLWWGGDLSRRISPYRFIKTTDISRQQVGYMSKSKAVMEIIMKKLPYNIRIDSLSIKDRDKAFSDGFQVICAVIYPTLSKEELDERRVGDVSCVRFV